MLELEVIVRTNAIEVADRNTGLFQRLPNLADGADFEALSNYLRRDKTSNSLLARYIRKTTPIPAGASSMNE